MVRTHGSHYHGQTLSSAHTWTPASRRRRCSFAAGGREEVTGDGLDDSTQFVGNLGNGAGNTLTIPRASGFNTVGDYDILVKHANAEVSGRHDYNPQVVDRRLQVTEAGKGRVGKGYFRYTNAWNSFWERIMPVTLSTTGGAIVLGNDGPWAPDVDYVVIAPARLGQPSTVRVS